MQLIFLLCTFIGVAVQQVYCESCHLREIDLCISAGVFHYQSEGFPKNENDIDEWCITLTDVHQCLGNFTENCLSPMQKELLALTHDAFDSAKEMCNSGSEVRSRYLQHAECLAGAMNTDEFGTQLKDVQVGIETLFDVSFKQRFPLMCCTFRRFCKEIEVLAEKLCGAESHTMLRDVIKMIATDAPETICQSFDPSGDQCKAILVPSGTPSKTGDNKSQLGKLMNTALGSQ